MFPLQQSTTIIKILCPSVSQSAGLTGRLIEVKKVRVKIAVFEPGISHYNTMGSSLVQRWIRRIVSQTFSINPDRFSVQTSTYSEKEVDVIISKIHNMI